MTSYVHKGESSIFVNLQVSLDWSQTDLISDKDINFTVVKLSDDWNSEQYYLMFHLGLVF